MDGFTKVVLAVVGVFNLAAGLWAFFSPASFYDQLATFPPFNEHFLHDVGAFQIGMGVALLAALRFSDAAFVVLAGIGTGTVFHVAAHAIDRDLGGQASDIAGLALVALLLVVAAALRFRALLPSAASAGQGAG